jgi:hypothetical protein
MTEVESGGGVQVAPGDPGGLTAAAQAHAELSPPRACSCTRRCLRSVRRKASTR